MDRSQLQTLLPHQGQALWLDQVLTYDSLSIEGISNSAHLQAFSSLANPAYLFEAAAQLCAAHGALRARAEPQPSPVRMAMVGKLSQLKVHHNQLPENTDIHLCAEQEALSAAGALYAFSASHQQQCLVDGKLLLVLVRD